MIPNLWISSKIYMRMTGYILKEAYRKASKVDCVVSIICLGPTSLLFLILGGYKGNWIFIVIGIVLLIIWICGSLFNRENSNFRYTINEEGISITGKGRSKKCFPWESISKIEIMSLKIRLGGGNFVDEYYVISTNDSYIAKDYIVKNMRQKKIICIPRTQDTDQCIGYYSSKRIK